jgi:hypothetical protein
MRKAVVAADECAAFCGIMGCPRCWVLYYVLGTLSKQVTSI